MRTIPNCIPSVKDSSSKLPFRLCMPSLLPFFLRSSYFFSPLIFECTLSKISCFNGILLSLIQTTYFACLFIPFESDQYECTVGRVYTVLIPSSSVPVHVVLFSSQLLFCLSLPPPPPLCGERGKLIGF